MIVKNKNKTFLNTQAKAVIEKINEITQEESFVSIPLWLPALEEIYCHDINYEEAYYGLSDDYYHNKQEYLVLKKESEYYYVISPYYEERVSFIYCILHALFKTVSRKDELYLIDDLSLLDDSFLQIAQLISMFQSDDVKKLKQLYKHIEEKKDLSIHTTILSTDLYSFMQYSEQNI